MFEFHYSTFLKAILMLACVLGGCEYLSKLDRLKAELAEVKELAGPARETAELRKQEWNEIKRAKDKLDALAQREEELRNQKDMLDQKERKLTGEIKYLAASMESTVEKVRKADVGTAMAELKLPERAALQNAKILKIHDDSITFLHEDGVANLKLQAYELPKELIAKYDLGTSGFVKSLQRLEKEIAGPDKIR